MRAIVGAVLLMLAAIPAAATGQTLDRKPFGVQAAGGSIVNGGGSVLSAAFGYAPASWVELLVNVERDHLPFEVKQFPGGGSGATRGGTLTFVSGEVRLGPTLGRVSPFALAGIGGGTSRPNVNAMFPTPVTNDLQVVYFGGGIRVPLGAGVSVIGDARAMLAAEGDDGILGMVPVRAGLAWRF